VHPPQRQGVSVTTIFDLGPLTHPEWYAADIAAIHRRNDGAAAEQDSAIIAISEFTRREFLRLYHFEPCRVFVVYPGVSDRFRPQDPERAIATARRFGIREPFLLYVGTWERRKNIRGLIDIFACVREQQRDLTLAIVGMRPWREAAYVHGVESWDGREVEDRLRRLEMSESVRVVGQVSLQELVELYSAAQALLYPTLYEGFGIPALEAMACGLPVVASCRTAIPEVVGDAGLLVDPDNVDEFAAATLRILGDAELRKQCRTKGIERASRFTWEAAARATLQVYSKAQDWN
jgi:alpha-1,3-rhamnosyl/mannosyltransferase